MVVSRFGYKRPQNPLNRNVNVNVSDSLPPRPAEEGAADRLPVPRPGPPRLQQHVPAEVRPPAGGAVLHLHHGAAPLLPDRLHPAGRALPPAQTPPLGVARNVPPPLFDGQVCHEGVERGTDGVRGQTPKHNGYQILDT